MLKNRCCVTCTTYVFSIMYRNISSLNEMQSHFIFPIFWLALIFTYLCGSITYYQNCGDKNLGMGGEGTKGLQQTEKAPRN